MAATFGTNILVEIASLANPTDAEPVDGSFVSLSGRTTGFSISGDRTDTEPEFGEADAKWNKPGAPTSQGWEVPFSAYWKDGDTAFLMVESAVRGKNRAGAAVSNYLYIRVYPRGKVSGATVYKGPVTVDGFDNSFNRTDTLDSDFGFTGYGEPVIVAYP